MANIKVLKFLGAVPTELNWSVDSVPALSFIVGGPTGTALTKAILDTLSGGTSSDATSLHSHDSRYYTKGQFVQSSVGSANAANPMALDARGKIDPSFYQQSDISHSNLSGLSNDDHPQYYNQTRGDTRYYTKAQHISTSAGVADAAKPVITNAQGVIDGTLLGASAGSINHENLSGLLGGAPTDHFHFTSAEHSTLQSGSADASALHNHNTQYYTKSQIDASLALKANDNIVIKKDGSVAFTATQSMGGFKLTNVANGVAGTDAINLSQLAAAVALDLPLTGGTMSGSINMGGNNVTNVADPVNPADAANKRYVDSSRAGLAVKDPVRLATTGNIAVLSGAMTVDGVAVATGDRILVKNQTSANLNGIYIASTTGAWTRSSDFDGTGTPSNVNEGAYVFVDLGTVWTNSAWVLTTVNPITVGTSNLTFTRYNAAGQLVAGSGISISGDTISVVYGAGITSLPTNDIGINLYALSGLALVDPSTGLASTAANAQLAHKLADATLVVGASGLAAGVMQTANIADQAITTAKHADASVTQPKLANASVGTAQLIDANVTTAKILDANVTGSKLAPTVAGVALSQNVSTKALDVQVDNTSIDINGSNQVEIKTAGVTNAKIAALAVNAPKIDFGTGTNQVNASNLPITNPNSQFLATNTETALEEIADATYVNKDFASGETIGQGDLVCLRRDSSNALKLFKASAASADNVIAASKVIQDITYTAVNNISFSGNAITITYVNPGAASAALSVSVTGNAIQVSLATNGSAAVTSTAGQIQAAVAGSGSASALVTAVVTGTSANIQTAQTVTSLSAGADYNDNGRWDVFGAAMDAAASAGTVIRVKIVATMTCTFVSAPVASDIGKTVYLSINKGAASLVAPSNSGDGLVAIGRLISTTQMQSKPAVLRGVNG